MHRIARFVLPTIVILVIGLVGGSAASPTPPPTRQDIAKKILNSIAGQTLTSPARAYMESVARGDRNLSPDSTGTPAKGARITSGKPTGGGSLTNVRVNNPAEDTQTDQTTQSETSIAVAGSNVAVGFNDSQHALLFLTAGGNLSGVAYSNDGGATFHDGGVLPNDTGNVNVGDPWLASDSGGTMYYSTLTFQGTTLNLLVGVSTSTNGGVTWTPAVAIPNPPSMFFYSADKDALTTGPGNGNLYDVWDDFTVDQSFNIFSGLPVAHSTDGGHTWTVVYASKIPLFGPGCSFHQYIGAQPLAVSGSTVFDAAEMISVDDPNCTFTAPVTFSEAVFVSNDGGSTWSAGANIPITSSTQGFGAFILGPAQLMRNLEFPTLAAFKGSVYMAWNDGGDGSGHSHVRLAQLDMSGNSLGTSFVTSGTNDEAQPAMSSDSQLHIAYYQISTASNGTGQLDVFISNSNNANSWKTQRVTSQSFPGVFTFPQFDPIIAFAYMGDYIAQVSDGQHQFIAWGDNRDIVTNILWAQGRNDPDVFFAKQ